MKPVSKKGKKKQQEYKSARESHYSKEENQKCALCGTTNNLSIHHMKKRLEGNHANEDTFVTLCILGNAMDAEHPELNSSQGLGCHNFVERNKGWARDNNLL